MKKTSTPALLALMLCIFLSLPFSGIAQTRPKIRSVDLTIPVPTPGMSISDACELQFTSAKTEFGDLAPSGGIAVLELDWTGDFRENDEGDMFFKDGLTYKAKLKFIVASDRYETDYIFKDNEYYIDGSRISATVNGNKAKVLSSAPYVISIEFFVNVGNGGKGSERDAAQSKPTDYELNKNSSRASQKAYSLTEADAACPDINPFDVIIVNDTNHPKFQAARYDSEFVGHKNMLVTKIIVDTDNENIYSQTASDVNNFIQGTYNIREVWLSGKVDVMAFIRGIFSQTQAYYDTKRQICIPSFSFLFYSQRATLFIPEEALGDVLAAYNRPTWSYHPLFSIKTYSGDVYAAQKKGADAAKPICSSHVFNDKVAAADKIFKYGTCGNPVKYYYSCRICGECEHNPKHVFSTAESGWFGVHGYENPLADEQAYIGENSAGQHVWWYSCLWCGHSYGYDMRHVTQAEWKASGNAASYETYCKAISKMTADQEEEALLSTRALPDMFILKRKSGAKMSRAFQSSVNFALNDNLIDEDILGNDYTLQLNWHQLCSLSGNLIKELTLKEAKPSALGLDKIPEVENNAGDSPVSRQVMAAVMYRTLRYIEECGVYSYTEYTPSLDKYSDCGSIAPWAREAMEFMEALELMKPTPDGKFSPEKMCTIEEAIDLAEKCTHAHQIGWYQARCWGEGKGRDYKGNVCTSPEVTTNHTYAPGERVWVTGPRIGVSSNYLPVIDPLTGTKEYVKAEWFRPIRKHVFTGKRTLTGPVIFMDYFDGAAAKALP